MIIQKSLRSLRYAANGFRTAWREEHNFRIELGAAVLVLAVAAYFRFSFAETVAVLLSITLVISAELVNTAIEDLCDKVDAERDPTIKKVKDLMAAYVLTAVLGSGLIGLTVLYHHFLV